MDVEQQADFSALCCYCKYLSEVIFAHARTHAQDAPRFVMLFKRNSAGMKEAAIKYYC